MTYLVSQDPPINLFDAVAEYRKKLAAEYLDKIGYDPFEDDPTISVEEVQNILEGLEAIERGEMF